MTDHDDWPVPGPDEPVDTWNECDKLIDAIHSNLSLVANPPSHVQGIRVWGQFIEWKP